MRITRVFLMAAVGVCLVPGASSFAAKVKKEKKKDEGVAAKSEVSRELFLYQGQSGQSIALEGQPKPNRVHVRFSTEFNDWVFVLSDRHGHFAEPMEVLVAGTVVNGESVGTIGGRYVFQPGGRWASTTEPRRLRVVVLGDIPSYKTVSYEPAGDSPVLFVNSDYEFNFSTYDPFALR